MVETNDGFEIARRDLEIRGPGEFLGARQSGAPLLRFADLAVDTEWLDWARSFAAQMLHKCWTNTPPWRSKIFCGGWVPGLIT